MRRAAGLTIFQAAVALVVSRRGHQPHPYRPECPVTGRSGNKPMSPHRLAPQPPCTDARAARLAPGRRHPAGQIAPYRAAAALDLLARGLVRLEKRRRVNISRLPGRAHQITLLEPCTDLPCAWLPVKQVSNRTWG